MTTTTTTLTKEDLLRQLAAIERDEKEQENARRAAKRKQTKRTAVLRAKLMKQANYRPIDLFLDQDNEQVKEYLWQEMPATLTAGVDRNLCLTRCVDFSCGCMSAYFKNLEENIMGYPRYKNLRDEERHVSCHEHGERVRVTTEALDAQEASVVAELAAIEAQKQTLLKTQRQIQKQRLHVRCRPTDSVPAIPSRFPWNNKKVFDDLCAAAAAAEGRG